MANMSYCRFENTARDLADCREYLHDELKSSSELEARKRLVELCRDIVADLAELKIEPAQLGTDDDPAAAIECPGCHEPLPRGLGPRCEECEAEALL